MTQLLTTEIGDRPCGRAASLQEADLQEGAVRKRRIMSKEGVLPIKSVGKSPQEAQRGVAAHQTTNGRLA
jgi:hypothetical protein